MKKLLLTLMAMLSLSSVFALTPQDLNGMTVMQLFYGVYEYRSAPMLSATGKFRYDSAKNQLYIDNFRGRFTLKVSIKDDKLVLPINQVFSGEGGVFTSGLLSVATVNKTDIHYAYSYYYGGVVEIGSTVERKLAHCYIPQTNERSISAGLNEKDAYSNIAVPNFAYDLQNDNKCIILRNSSNSTVTAGDQDENPVALFSRITFFLLDHHNTIAEDSKGRKYDMNIAFKIGENGTTSDDEVIMPNFLNKGICYEDYYLEDLDAGGHALQWLTGKIDRDNGKITVDPIFSGGLFSPSDIRYGTFYSGTFSGGESDPEYYFNGKYIPYAYGPLVNWTGWWLQIVKPTLYNQVTTGGFRSVYDADPIVGDLTVTKTYHETPDHRWAATAGGNLHTYEDWDAMFGKAEIWNQAVTKTNAYGLEDKIDWTKIKVDKLDVTHHCTINEGLRFGYGKIKESNSDIYIYVSGEVNQLKNNHHLDDVAYYEYYLVPGLFDAPNGSDFNSPDGHVKGVNVTDYVSDFQPGQGKNGAVRKANDLNSGNSFNLLIPEKRVLGTNSGKQSYTLYVKANYKDGLEPTFHALTPLSNRTTGVSDLVLDLEPATVEVVNGSIVIEGSNGTATVSTLSGVVIYQGDDATVDVAPGTYIVRAGGVVKKLLVK